jgi:hypothetical protein
MLNKHVLGSLLAAVLSTSAALAEETPGPNEVQIDGISYGGSGCSQGSVGVDLASDRRAFTLIFDEYILEFPAASQKSCEIDVNLTNAPGWQFAIFQVQVRGYAMLDPGVTGKHKLSIHAAGGGQPAKSEMKKSGPFDDDYIVTGSLTNNLKWSQCQHTTHRIKIKSASTIEGAASAAGLMTVDSIDGSLTQKYGMSWRRCSGNGPNGNGGGNGHGNGHGNGRGNRR